MVISTIRRCCLHPKEDHLVLQGVQVDLKLLSHTRLCSEQSRSSLSEVFFVIWSKNKPLELILVDLQEHFSVGVKYVRELMLCITKPQSEFCLGCVWLWHQKFICPNQPEHPVYINCKLAHKGRHRGCEFSLWLNSHPREAQVISLQSFHKLFPSSQQSTKAKRD